MITIKISITTNLDRHDYCGVEQKDAVEAHHRCTAKLKN